VAQPIWRQPPLSSYGRVYFISHGVVVPLIPWSQVAGDIGGWSLRLSVTFCAHGTETHRIKSPVLGMRVSAELVLPVHRPPLNPSWRSPPERTGCVEWGEGGGGEIESGAPRLFAPLWFLELFNKSPADASDETWVLISGFYLNFFIKSESHVHSSPPLLILKSTTNVFERFATVTTSLTCRLIRRWVRL